MCFFLNIMLTVSILWTIKWEQLQLFIHIFLNNYKFVNFKTLIMSWHASHLTFCPWNTHSPNPFLFFIIFFSLLAENNAITREQWQKMEEVYHALHQILRPRVDGQGERDQQLGADENNHRPVGAAPQVRVARPVVAPPVFAPQVVDPPNFIYVIPNQQQGMMATQYPDSYGIRLYYEISLMPIFILIMSHFMHWWKKINLQNLK